MYRQTGPPAPPNPRAGFHNTALGMQAAARLACGTMPLGLPAAPWPPPEGWTDAGTREPDPRGVQTAWLARQLDLVAGVAGDPRAEFDPDHLLSELLSKVTEAVGARGSVVATAGTGGPSRTWSVGLTPPEIERLTAQLGGTGPGGSTGPAPRADLLVVPLATPRQHFGWLGALHPTEGAWRPTDRQTLEVFAKGAACSLEALRELDLLRRSERTVRALLDLAHRLAQVFSVEEVAEVLASAVAEVTGASRASAWLWDATTGQLQRVAVAEASSGRLEARAASTAERTVLRPEDDPLAWQLVRARSSVLATLDQLGPTVAAILREGGCQWVAAVPVIGGGELLGAVTAAYVGEPPGAGTPADQRRGPGDILERLQGLADQAATAVTNARLLGQLRHVAWHDPLTGLPNRRLLEDRAVQALQQAERTGQVVGLLFVDLDRFKEVNDSLGHHAGDQVVIEAAQRLRRLVRTQDTVARFGGDELAVLLPEVADPEAPERLAERALATLGTPYRLPTGPITVTASIGLASVPPVRRTFTDLLQAADMAMYEAKQTGRNRWRRAAPAETTWVSDTLGTPGSASSPAPEPGAPLPCQPIYRLADGQCIGALLEPAPTWGTTMGRLERALAGVARAGGLPPTLLLPLPADRLRTPGHLHEVLSLVQQANVRPDRLVVVLHPGGTPALPEDELAVLVRRLGRVGIRCALPWGRGQHAGLLERARPAVVLLDAADFSSALRPEESWRGPLSVAPPTRVAVGLSSAEELTTARALGVAAASGPLLGPAERELTGLLEEHARSVAPIDPAARARAGVFDSPA